MPGFQPFVLTAVTLRRDMKRGSVTYYEALELTRKVQGHRRCVLGALRSPGGVVLALYGWDLPSTEDATLETKPQAPATQWNDARSTTAAPMGSEVDAIHSACAQC